MVYPITELYAWIVDDPTGEHGIIGVLDHNTGMMMQAVSSKRRNMERQRPFAEATAKALGLPVHLKCFSTGTVIEEIKP